MRAVLPHLCSVAPLVGLAAAGIPAAHGADVAMKITTDNASIRAAKALYDRIVASAKKHS
jgi:hypothetical protein